MWDKKSHTSFSLAFFASLAKSQYDCSSIRAERSQILRGQNDHQNILFITALTHEARQLFDIQGLSPVFSSGSGALLYEASLNSGLFFGVTGMGATLAKEGLERLIHEIAPARVYGFGYCGGLRRSAKTGGLVVAERILFEKESFSPVRYLLDEVQSAARGLGVSNLYRSIFTSSEIVNEAPDRAAVFAAYDVDVVDMESGVWAKVCEEKGLPWIITRVILDTPDYPLPSWILRLGPKAGQPPWQAIAWQLFAHPSSLFELIRLRSHANLGANVLRPLVQSLVSLKKE